MRDYLDNKSRQMALNFTLLATPAEGLFRPIRAHRPEEVRRDPRRPPTGKYYTNSFHVPCISQSRPMTRLKSRRLITL
jgi:ribonucleoside-triphosphate reductase